MNMNPLENKFCNIWSLLFSPNECIVLLIFLSVLEQTGTCEPGVWLFLVLLCCSLTVVTKMQMKIRKCSLLNISVGSVKLLSLSSVIIRFINCARFTVKLMNLMLFQLLPPKKSKNEKAINRAAFYSLLKGLASLLQSTEVDGKRFCSLCVPGRAQHQPSHLMESISDLLPSRRIVRGSLSQNQGLKEAPVLSSLTLQGCLGEKVGCDHGEGRSQLVPS